MKPAIGWRAAGFLRDRGNPGPYHTRSDGRTMSRAAVVKNLDRTEARYREGRRKDTYDGAITRYYAAMAGKTATLSAERS
eukprot:3000363-Pyramimonas_sp.AAC.1